jgi:hypothetical protein
MTAPQHIALKHMCQLLPLRGMQIETENPWFCQFHSSQNCKALEESQAKKISAQVFATRTG